MWPDPSTMHLSRKTVKGASGVRGWVSGLQMGDIALLTLVRDMALSSYAPCDCSEVG